MKKINEAVETISVEIYVKLFTDEFIQKNSKFDSFKHLWNSNESELKDGLSFFDYIESEEWDKYIDKVTSFNSFVEMEFAAKVYERRWIEE